ncbi:chromosome partition protein Smc-like isoform X2 [Pecten maximus]|uniref:chromosome partition protein Smc-like isoform X2 n=1 Tax=Pecten maximus TaxID=6579 RepID=UPI0014588CC7|nr:chromosome partition protein Smc-like isoform X2 [Pecten maximus]
MTKRRTGPKMASGGQVMPSRPDLSMDQTRDNELGIQGQGMTTRVPEIEITTHSMSQSTLSTPTSSSRPSTGELTDPGEPLGAFSVPPEAVGVLETVININKTLEHQIDTLRIRIDVEAKHHEQEKKKMITEKERALQQKEAEIAELRGSITNREGRIDVLVKEREEQDLQISAKMDEISGLRDLVQQTEDYADQLTKKVGKLKDVKRQLESDTVYKHQNEEIRKLKHELVTMKERLNSMESELVRARNIMEQQNKKIKFLEFEKSEMNTKFRDELEKASRAMRQEVERMREVMKQQYEEMRNLREQNKEISNDVRDIKDILLSTRGPAREHAVNRGNQKDQLGVNQFPKPTQGSQTARFSNVNAGPWCIETSNKSVCSKQRQVLTTGTARNKQGQNVDPFWSETFGERTICPQ